MPELISVVFCAVATEKDAVKEKRRIRKVDTIDKA